MWIYHILFIHLSVGELLDCFPFLAIVNNAAVNISVQVFMWIFVIIPLRFIPRSGIVDGDSMFNFL